MRTRQTRAAFTLVELLVVLVIIAVLMTIGLVIGARARAAAREAATRDTIKTLDSALTELQTVLGELPKPFVKIETGNVMQVMVDAGNSESCSWFTYQASKVTSANQVLQSIPAKFVAVASDPAGESPGRRVINDAFGNPIRYVHPAFHGVYGTRQVADTFIPPAGSGITYRPVSVERHSTPDNFASDGGQCSGNRPYFYSCGADGKPETRDDNIYSESGKPAFVDGP